MCRPGQNSFCHCPGTNQSPAVQEELSQRCRALELPAYGKKQVLIARLQERLALQDAGVAAAASGVEGLDAAPGREPPPGLQEQPLYIYGPSSSPVSDLICYLGKQASVQPVVILLQQWQCLW